MTGMTMAETEYTARATRLAAAIAPVVRNLLPAGVEELVQQLRAPRLVVLIALATLAADGLVQQNGEQWVQA